MLSGPRLSPRADAARSLQADQPVRELAWESARASPVTGARAARLGAGRGTRTGHFPRTSTSVDIFSEGRPVARRSARDGAAHVGCYSDRVRRKTASSPPRHSDALRLRLAASKCAGRDRLLSNVLPRAYNTEHRLRCPAMPNPSVSGAGRIPPLPSPNQFEGSALPHGDPSPIWHPR